MKKIKTTIRNSCSIGVTFRRSIIMVMMLVLITVNGWGQTPQLKQWALPTSLVDFSGGSPVSSALPMPTSPIPTCTSCNNYGSTVYQANYASNSYYDVTGHLLFFIVDDNVYDKDGYYIDQLKFGQNPPGSGPGYILAGEISIVPMPGSSTQYYIIIGVGYGLRFHPEYGVLDMSLPNPNFPSYPKYGALTYYSTTATNDLGTAGINMISLATVPTNAYDPFDYSTSTSDINESNRFGLAVTPYRCENNNYFLYISGYAKLYRYTIDASGINFDSGASDSGIADPFTSAPLSTIPNGNNMFYTELEIIKVPGTSFYRLAKVYGGTVIVIDDFNYSDGTFYSQAIIDMTLVGCGPSCPAVKNIVGLEFSPNGNYLFYDYDLTNSSSVTDYNINGYVNVGTSSYSDFPFSMCWSNSSNPITGGSHIELGYDGKMYYNDGISLRALNGNPNGPTTGWTALTTSVLNTAQLQNLVDQIDGQDYGTPAFAGDDACCMIDGITTEFYTANTSDGFAASTTQLWTQTSNPFIAIYNAAHPSTPVTSIGGSSDPIVIGNTLTIPPKFDITIQGMTFKFITRVTDCSHPELPNAILRYGARTIVQNGAFGTNGGRLTLDKSTVFTSFEDCEKGMWEGIEVWGVTSTNPGSGRNGRLYVNNESEISNAIYGATAGMKNNYEPDNSSANNGGWIRCDVGASFGTYSTFRNNHIDVDFPNCPGNTCQSAFTYTRFITDDYLHDKCYVPHAHAELYNVQGINFRTCDFNNMVPTYYTQLQTTDNFGIEAEFSLFNCIPAVPLAGGVGYGGCTFENLSYGVTVANKHTYPVGVTNSVFKNNYRGIYLNSVDYATINVNNFYIYPLPLAPWPNSWTAAYGLYIDFSSGFSVEANYFIDNNSTYAQDNDYGIIVNETNPSRACGQADLIYRNNFEYLNIGIQTQGNNSERFSPKCPNSDRNVIGLVMQCNDFEPTLPGKMGLFDINVTDGSWNYGNIAYHQGVCGLGTTATANNKFSHSYCSSDYWITYPNASNPEYDFKMEASNLPLFPSYNQTDFSYSDYDWISDPKRPYCYTPDFQTFAPHPTAGLAPTLCGYTVYDDSKSCPSNLVNHRERMMEDMAKDNGKIDSLQSILSYGDRQGLVDTINGASESVITSALLGSSPYLSDRVLLAAIAKGLTASDIQSVLVSNSPLSSQVKQAADNVSLPASVHNNIDSAQNNPSAKNAAIAYLSYYSSQKQLNADALIRFNFNNQNLDNALDSSLDVLGTSNIPYGKTKIDSAKIYLAKGDITSVTNLVNQIRPMGGNDGFCDFMEVLVAVKQAGGNDSMILADANLLTKVLNVASDNQSSEQGAADKLLHKLNGNIYHEWITPNAISANTRMMMLNQQNQTDKPALSDSHWLAIYPNPANEEVTVEVKLPDDVLEATLEVVDVTGRSIEKSNITASGKSTINTSDFAKGVYLCTLKSKNKKLLIDKVKLVIIK